MLRKILNLLIFLTCLLSLYYGYIIIFELPDDSLQLAELKLHSSYAFTILAILSVIRLNIKRL